MDPITIRKATERDVDALGVLFIELDKHHIQKRPTEFLRLQGPARSREAIAQMVEAQAGAILVAEDRVSRRLIGLAHVEKRELPATIVAPARSVAEVDSLVVSSDARRKGIATRLLVEARRWAGQNGLDVLELSVREFNAEALAFYKAFGMVTASRRMTLSARVGG